MGWRILIAALLAAMPLQARVSLGQFGHWGAFRDGARCFAIAEPVSERRGGAPMASFVGARGARLQVSARLSRETDAGRPVTLSLGDRRFVLIARDGFAWAKDGRDDIRIIAAARGGERMIISATDRRGRRFRDIYPLPGAASAIDAALLGCLGR